jgi:hypothetical protein
MAALLIIVSTWPPGERVLFIGTPFSNLYTSVDTSAMGLVYIVHFACVVVYEEASVLEVLVREQDFLCLRKEQPGLAEAQDDCSPLVGLLPKGQVIVLCNLGIAEQILQLRTPGVFAHDVLWSVGDRDLRLCVGVRIADGVCNEEICSQDRAYAGIREEGGKRETHE